MVKTKDQRTKKQRIKDKDQGQRSRTKIKDKDQGQKSRTKIKDKDRGKDQWVQIL